MKVFNMWGIKDTSCDTLLREFHAINILAVRANKTVVGRQKMVELTQKKNASPDIKAQKWV